MLATQFHLMVNHIALIGIPLSLILLLIGYVKNNDLLKRVACLFFVGLALIVVPTFLSGEPAEEHIEQLSGISRQSIDYHEEAAEVSLVLALITGGAAGAILLFWKLALRKYILISVAMLSLVTTLSLGITAHFGGQIRHTELGGLSNVSQGVHHNNRGDQD